MTRFRGRGAEATPEELEPIARELELAAAEAPPSPRVDDVRMRLLASLEGEAGAGGGRPVPGVVLAAVVVLLLALVVAVGAPAVGSYLEGVFDEASPVPAPVVPSPSRDPASRGESEDMARVPRVRTDAPEPSPSAVVGAEAAAGSGDSGGSVSGATRPAGATPMPTPIPPPTPSPTRDPWPPADPPVEVPSPPIEPPAPPSLPPPVGP